MRSDELLTAFRYGPFIGDGTAFPDYSDARLLVEMTDVLKTVFTGFVVDARSGYWLQSTVLIVINGTPSYSLPDRCTAGGVETVEFQDTNGKYRRLDLLPEDQTTELSAAPAGVPQYYVIRANRITLLPAPTVTSQALRIAYYIRPSRLVQPQSSTLAPAPNNVVRGLITAVSTVFRQLTVNAVPFDQELSSPAAITSAVQLIDVVHPGGSYELSLVGSTQTLAGNVFTLPVGTDMSNILAGDYVRAAEQTDWPPVPEDYHRLVADIAAIKVMTQLGWADKAQLLSSATAGDIDRLNTLFSARVRSQPENLVASNLVSSVRLAADIKTDDKNYTVARILDELNDAMLTVFTDLVVSASGSYWLRTFENLITTANLSITLPQRSASNGLQGAAIAPSGVGVVVFHDLIEVSPRQLQALEQTNANTGEPRFYALFGDQIRFTPKQDRNYTLRLRVYLRPSEMVPQQNSIEGGGSVRGQITAVNAGAGTVTVNALPFDMSLAIPAAITTAVQRVDIVRNGGGYEAIIADATQTISGLVLTLGTLQGQTLSDVQVGDWVRVADQTDWPALPREYHRLVADATAVAILTANGAAERARPIAARLAAGLTQFRNQIQNRVKDQPNLSMGLSSQTLDQPIVDALLDGVRLAAGISTSDEQYPATRICQEITDAVHNVIGDIVLKARSGMWLKQRVSNTVAGVENYRLFHRAFSQGLEAVEIALDGVNFQPLYEIPAAQAYRYESNSSSDTGSPRYFMLRGDQIVLMPAPNGVYPLRQTFYIRPSTMMLQPWASASLTGRGRIQSFNTSARTITLGSGLPYDTLNKGTIVATSGQKKIDVIHASGSCELAMFDVSYTHDGASVFTITDATLDMSEIVGGSESGDFPGRDIVRVSGTTDWPPVPIEFHRMVADMAAARILRAKGDQKRARNLEESLEGDIVRFRSTLVPRVKSQPQITPIALSGRTYSAWPWRN